MRLSQQISIEIIHEIHSSYARFTSVHRDTCRTNEGRRMWSVWAWQHVLPLNCQTTESKKKLTFALSVHPTLFSRPFPPSTLPLLARGFASVSHKSQFDCLYVSITGHGAAFKQRYPGIIQSFVIPCAPFPSPSHPLFATKQLMGLHWAAWHVDFPRTYFTCCSSA